MNSIRPYLFHIILVLGFIVVSLVLYVLYPSLVTSNLYFAAVTFFVGLSAFYLYTTQKIDTRREVANIIISEVRFAEARINQYKQVGAIQVSFFMEPILPNNTWSKNHHLFIRDLDPDEYSLVREFYNKCTLLDRALERLNSASQLDQKAGSMYEGLSRIAANTVIPAAPPLTPEQRDQLFALFRFRASAFVEMFTADGSAFQPDAPRAVVAQVLQQINTIMTTTAGEKLKQIAGLK